MKQSPKFKSYEEVKEYIGSLTLEEHMRFCEEERLNILLETEGPFLSFDDYDIPTFKGSFDDMVKKYNGILPAQLMDMVTSGMFRKLKSFKDV